MLKILPFVSVSDDGVETVLVFPGGAAGGKDLAINIGGTARQLTAKRDGVLLDTADGLGGLPLAGSGIITQSFGLNTSMLTVSTPLLSEMWVMVNIPAKTTVTGVEYLLSIAANYTSGANNQVALYSLNPATGDLTRIAISTANVNLWKGTLGLRQEPFTAPVSVDPGVYVIGLGNDGTAVITAPSVVSAPDVAFTSCCMLDLPNHISTFASGGGGLPLPSSANYLGPPGLNPIVARWWFALY